MRAVPAHKHLEDLRGGGWFVTVSHRRPAVGTRIGYDDDPIGMLTRADVEALRERGLAAHFAQCGGETVVRIYRRRGDERPAGEGVARCSVKDVFCYRLGLQIAVGRALKDLHAARALVMLSEAL